MGVVTTVVAFYLLKRDMKRGNIPLVGTYDNSSEQELEQTEDLLTMKQKKFFALVIPIAFVLDVVAMALFDLQGGDATALVGGTSVLILLILCVVAYKKKGLDQTTSYFIKGFQFGF